jgi:hypothetical protein
MLCALESILDCSRKRPKDNLIHSMELFFFTSRGPSILEALQTVCIFSIGM